MSSSGKGSCLRHACNRLVRACKDDISGGVVKNGLPASHVGFITPQTVCAYLLVWIWGLRDVPDAKMVDGKMPHCTQELLFI